jgi:hypothetical protein
MIDMGEYASQVRHRPPFKRGIGGIEVEDE